MSSSIKKNNTSSLSPSELYSIQFQNPEPKHYTRVPNIIDHLTYDDIDKKTGKKVVKKLSVYAKELYRIIRSISGDMGACWQNRDHLAELANMSSGSISNAKKELTQKFHQLDGNPLIILSENKKGIKSQGKIIGGCIYHKIFITDIWRWNNAYMSTLKYQNHSCPSPHDGEDVCPSPHDIEPPGCPSPHDTNNISLNKIPLSKEQHPAAVAASVVSLNKKGKEKMSPSVVHKDSHEWLIKNHCDRKSAESLAIYPLKELLNGVRYTDRQMAKKKINGEIVENKWGYLRRVLENRYWEKNSK